MKLKRKPKGYWKTASDSDVILEVEMHRGKTIRAFRDSAQHLYRVALNRGLIPKLVKKGVLKSLQRTGISESLNKLNDDQLVALVKESYQGCTLGEVHEKDIIMHRMLIQRGLIELVVDEGILIQKKLSDGTWKDKEFALAYADAFLSEHHLTELPTNDRLLALNAGGLAYAIKAHHGGLAAFRRELRSYCGSMR
ncbi:hypothetical protein HYZ97_01335 [Candidatus Pacearchaeota archaeon]|nr:hypothetical protein [Candidatus Pacearchaeota archaeon]